jgi:hypothetical protein
MPIFEVEHNGTVYEVDAPDEVTASRAFDQPQAGKGKSRVRAAAQGLTLGFGDEIESAVTGTPTDTIRAEMQAYQQAHPGEALGLELAGGLPLMFIPGLNVAKGVKGTGTAATIWNQMRTGAAIGGAFGAVQGAGTAEGGLGERAQGALTQGLFGVGAGAAIPPLFSAAGSLGHAVKNKMGISVGGLVEEKGDDIILRALERDRLQPGNMAAPAAPMTLADAAGTQTNRTLRGAMSVPGQAKGDATEFLLNRAAGQTDRLARDLDIATGMAPENIIARKTQIMEQARQQAKPLYEKAYQENVQFGSDQILPILKNPHIKSAFDKAKDLYEVERSLAAVNGRQLPPLRELYRQTGTNAFEATGTQADVRTLDYLQRGLQDEIDAAYRGGQGGLAEQLIAAKKQILGLLESKSTEFRDARALWRGAKTADEALDEGRLFLRKDPRLIQKELADLTPAEQQVYRAGAVDALRVEMQKIGDGRDFTRRLMSKEMRERLRPFFAGPNEYNQFLTAVSREAKMNQTKNVLSGSPTARIQSELDDIEGASGVSANIIESLTTGRWKLAAGQAAAAVTRKATGLTPEVTDYMVPKLLNPDPVANQQYLEKLAGINRMRLDRNALESGRRASYAAGAASLPGLLQ